VAGEVLLHAVARALRAEGLSEDSIARAVYDKHHHWYHRGPDSKKLGDDGDQDLQLDPSVTGMHLELKEGDVIAVKYGRPREDLISTEDIAGCWCCVCAPCMFTACFRKEADGPDGLVHKGCLIFPFPIPFNEPRRRKGQTNKFAKHDDENNVDQYYSRDLVVNGPSFSLRLGS